MPRPALRSRSLSRRKVRTPGGRLVTHYRKKNTSKPQCAGCGSLLSGVPSMRKAGIGKMSKTQKRPTRPFGGYYCSSCSREAIKQRVMV